MLNELHIENIAVIERADISFSKGFNVLTGETGAGKSIVIDSIGAVLGERVSKELVRRGAEKATVSAIFDADNVKQWLDENEIECEDELILQRRISADGKSSCRVCGQPVTAAQLKELASLLVDIHGQNDGRQLMDERRHLFYLDSFGAFGGVCDAFKAEFNKYNALKKEIKKLSMDEIEKERLSESLSYQIAELEKAQLKIGEKDELESKRDLMRNFEKLSEAIDEAYGILYGGEDNAISMTQNASYYAKRASSYAKELAGAAKSLEEASFLITDAAETLRDFRDGIDFSPEEYDRLETRLSLLNKLERKYGKTDEELLKHLDKCRAKLDEIEYSDVRLEKLGKALEEQKQICIAKALELSNERRNAALELQKRIESELKDLSMPSVRFAVDFAEIENSDGFDSTGMDDVKFVMSANAGEELGRISRIASGGELSRIMLAMKNVFAENDPVSTMIFDEIDTGVSGIAAQRVGEKLYSVSKGKQVMCVTHLPQIAAMADTHFVITKQERDERTYTHVYPLDNDGRAGEIARLYGGDNITEITLAGAKEQLKAAEAFKKSN